MEQHPVPQNVTGFQFKLIGDITLKQFAYLAGGIILGYIAFKIDLVPGIFRWPFVAFWVIFGFGLAFVPIEERPLDRMVMAFLKNIYSPTQFVWKKQNAPPQILTEQVALQPIVSSPVVTKPVVAPKIMVQPPKMTPPSPPPPLVVKPQPPAPIRSTMAPPRIPPKPAPPVAPKPDPWKYGAPPVPAKTGPYTTGPSITGKRIVFEEKKNEATKSNPQEVTKQVERVKSDYAQIEQKLKAEMEAMQKELEQGTIAKERFMELQQALTQLLNEKERLSQDLIKARKELLELGKSKTIKPTEYTTSPSDTTSTVKIVTTNQAVRVGIPTITDQPNVITGVIKESDGNLLPNLIVTVKDKDGIPVRALKTNKLGQFAASTPLTSGVYIIEVEDPKQGFKFNRIEVGLSGQVLPPLEISAISAKDIMRAKLTHELFGGNKL